MAMRERSKTLHPEKPRPTRRRSRPAKGTGAAWLELAGAWSFMGREEIDRIKEDIFNSRRSSS